MEYPSHESRYTAKSLIPSLLLIVIGIAVLAALLGYRLDSSCRAQALAALPDYPGATLVSEQYTGLRAWGIGETLRILSSPDTPDTVTGWYRRQPDTWPLPGAAHTEENALVGWNVRDDGSGGSRIVLAGSCGQGLPVNWQAR